MLTSLGLNLKFLSLHGKMVTKRRELLFKKYKSDPKAILLTTDVAARGLDIPDVELVVQFDPPQDPKQFSHRCGRTARIGKSGLAICFLLETEDTFVEFLKIRQIPITEYQELIHCNEELWKENSDIESKESLLKFIQNLNKQDREQYDRVIHVNI